MNDWEELSVRRLARFSMSVREGSKLPCLDPIQPMATEHLETNRDDRCSDFVALALDRRIGGKVTPWHRKVHHRGHVDARAVLYELRRRTSMAMSTQRKRWKYCVSGAAVQK